MDKITKPDVNKYHLPVVCDLGDGVGVGDRVLQVRHEHEVPRVVPVVVDGVVVDVAEDGLREESEVSSSRTFDLDLEFG